MKTKNVKVRLKHIKQGITVYVSHPVYGIEKLRVESKPYMHPTVKSLFIDTLTEYGPSTNSLHDMGVYSAYNGRRTFFKLKHAEKWMRKWSKSEQFIEQHARHEAWCEDTDMWDMWDIPDQLPDEEQDPFTGE
jgi:hypothetical protein